MRKIGILTINDYNNYGNRLQNYATQEVLKSLGFYVETVINNTQHNNRTQENIIDKIKGLTIKEFYNKLMSKIRTKGSRDRLYLYKTRLQMFKIFTSSHILETEYSIEEGNVPKDLSNRYDYFVIGSDQVWNPTFNRFSSLDFLTFAPKYKRIAYAPSFGISRIPSEYVEKFRDWISGIQCLSVRENAGAKIIKELTGRDAVVLVDPTLMLSKEKWLSISKPAQNKPFKEYLLTYFLGGIPADYKKKIHDIAKKNKLQVVNLADINDPETYITGPSEFIDFVNSASIFCTDSFHGVVFSILLETPFIVFDRAGNLPSMNSRIETILTTFKLESRHARNIKEEEIFVANYTHVGPILEYERKKALNYLKKSLGIKDD